MKKLAISLIISFLVLSLSGCAKKLTCQATLNETDDGVDMVTKVIVTFKNDVSSKVTMNYIFNDKTTAETYYSYMKEASDEYSLSGKTISVTQTPESDEELNYKDAKTQLEEAGYTCK